MEQCSGRWKSALGWVWINSTKWGAPQGVHTWNYTLGIQVLKHLSKSLQCVTWPCLQTCCVIYFILGFCMIWAVPPHSVWFPFCTGGYGPFQ